MNSVSNNHNGVAEIKILVAIPCYNESLAIGSVALKASRYVDEVLVVDDGSTDDTVAIAKAAGATVVSHGENKGYGAAIRSCFDYAQQHKFGIMIILDFVVMGSMTRRKYLILFMLLQPIGRTLLSALGFWRRISRIRLRMGMGLRMGKGYPDTGLQA